MKNLKVNKYTPQIIIGIGFLISLSITLFINYVVDQQIIKDNHQAIFELETKLKLAFEQYIHPLEGNASVYHLNHYNVSPEQFRKVAESRNFFKKFTGALGFGFIRYVKEQELNRYINAQVKLRPDFKLKRLNKDNSVKFTNDYYIIEVVEPSEINQKAIGLVVSDEKNRFEAAIKSMKEGIPTLTNSIQLVQDNTKVPGFLIYYPIYTTRTIPTSEAERIKNFIGWTYAPILSSAVFDFVKQLNANIPNVEILENKKTIFQNVSSKNDLLAQQKNMDILGNNWVVKYDENLAADQNLHHYTLTFLFLLIQAFFIVIAYLFHKKQKEMERLEKEDQITRQQIRIATETINSQRIFFKKMLDAIPSLVGYWDKSLHNVFCNATYTEFYGKTPEEIYGIHISELLPPHIYELNKPFLDKALQGEMQTFKRTMTNISGETFEVNAKYIPDYHQGNIQGIFVIVEDITAFVQKEDQVQMLLEVIEFAPVAIEITDKNNIIEYVNQFHVQNTGYSKDETIGFPPIKFASGKTSPEVYKNLKNKIVNQETWTGEFINKKKSGEEYIEQATISTILNHDGEISHYVAIKQDVTEFKKAESQLMFNSKLASIGEMAAGVAHEINNPLAIIQMSVDSLEKKSSRNQLTPEIFKDTMAKIKSHSDRIARIVKSLKLYTRDTTDEVFKFADTTSIIKSVLDLCLEKVKYKDIKFEVAKYDEFEIECNEIKIQQVLVNLINNAAEAIENNNTKWIKLVVEYDLQNVYFKVFDSGTISETTAEKMFNPFFTTKPVGKGTGLGLSISLNIAKEHQGTIYLDRNYANTCFVLKIPLEQVKKAQLDTKIAS